MCHILKWFLVLSFYSSSQAVHVLCCRKNEVSLCFFLQFGAILFHFGWSHNILCIYVDRSK
ncbi:hypothetical protein M758_3G085300 [Ceratodon purpureus]|uniref:Uncharacterized protein n=1 Tax=Ceratodon purpureus TaxID=3225 RepID=A0A8T0IHG6_CERPU|nr:hypothetical protein KC19_3G083900 [Ceratodon purpureus]KAG0622264.1 hypothetical protein M758_3G085300 [Ceratodon purpureus]